jgi:uncharacterized protein (UPF0303 family)
VTHIDLRSKDDLVKIAVTGGGFVLDAQSKPQEDLVAIAGATSHEGATLILRNVSQKTTDELVEIAFASKGSVIFSD